MVEASPAPHSGVAGPISHASWGRPLAFWAAIGSAGLMIVGSFGPWAHLFLFTFSGIDYEGWRVVAVAVAAVIVLTWWRVRPNPKKLTAPIVLGALGLAVVVLDGRDIAGDQSVGGETPLGELDLVTAGWGLYVTGFASAALVLSCVALLLLERPRPAPPVLGSPGEDRT